MIIGNSKLKELNLSRNLTTLMLIAVYANYVGPSVMTDANSERFLICDERITENDRCVIRIIGIHCNRCYEISLHDQGVISENIQLLFSRYTCTLIYSDDLLIRTGLFPFHISGLKSFPDY